MIQGYQDILLALVPVYLFIASGFVFRKIGWLNKHADTSLLKIQINVLYPALIFGYIFRNKALSSPSILLISPSIGFLTIVIGFAVAYVAAKMLGFKNGKGLRSFAFSTGIYNYGFIAIPLTNAVFKDDAVTGTLVVFNTGIEVAIWTVGILLLSGAVNRDTWKKILNPPVIALVVALLMNFLLPPIESSNHFFAKGFNAVIHTVHWLGECSIPIALILIGASVHDLTDNQTRSLEIKTILGGCIIRMAVLPCCFLLLVLFLPLPLSLKSVLVIQAAMPAGMFPIIMAKNYSGSPETAVQIVLSTTSLSLLTIPFWITIGQRLLF